MNLITRIKQYFSPGEKTKLLELEVERYRRIFKGSHNYGFVDWDMANKKMYWHGGYWKSLGYNANDMVKISNPETFLQFIHPEDHDALIRAIRDQLKKSVAHEGALFRIKKKSGGHVYTEIRTKSQRDESGWVHHVSGVLFDVTQVKQTEQALLESEARYGRIILAANDGIWEWSAEDNEFSFSSRCWEQLGFTEYEINKYKERNQFPTWRERIHPDDRHRFDDTLNSHIVKKGPFDLEYRIKGNEGDWRWIRSRGQMSFDRDEKPKLMSGTNMDITDLKLAEKRVLEAKEVAEVANKAKSEFLSAMSHELRTPLNAILGFAQLFDLDHNLTEDQRDNILEIKNAGRHLLKLVGDVLDLSKIESGRSEFSTELVSPVRVIKSCIKLLQDQADKRSITIELKETSFRDFVISVDNVRLKQVMINLISNAIKYNKHAGIVKIYCELDDLNNVKIYVEDEGKGISAKMQAELFQPFNRLGAEKTEVEGSGVGLVITKKLTEHMGGVLGVNTVVNLGSSFWVKFPQVVLEEDSDEELSNIHSDLPHLIVKDNKKILYIEDNASNLRLMSQITSRFPVLTLLEQEQALHGLFIARTQSPDLIIFDINLPGINGFEMLEVIKNDPKTKHIPVIALSANAMAHDIQKGREAGFDHYLTKPIDLSQFITVCNELLI